MSYFVELVRRRPRGADILPIDVLSWASLLKLGYLHGWRPSTLTIVNDRGLTGNLSAWTDRAMIGAGQPMSGRDARRLVLALVRALPDIPLFHAYDDEDTTNHSFAALRVPCIVQWWCFDSRSRLTNEVLPFLACGAFIVRTEEDEDLGTTSQNSVRPEHSAEAFGSTSSSLASDARAITPSEGTLASRNSQNPGETDEQRNLAPRDDAHERSSDMEAPATDDADGYPP